MSSIPTTDNTPDEISTAIAAVDGASQQVQQAKAALADAEQAYARAAEADLAAYDAAEAAGKSVSRLPSVALTAARDAAAARLRAMRARHQRAEVALSDAYQANAADWYRDEKQVAEQAEAECLSLLDALVETFDRARTARALADWTATTRDGHPMPFTGPERPSGEELLVGRVRNVLGVEARQIAAQARRAKIEARDREAAAEQAEIERQAEAARRQAEHEEGENRARQSIAASLAAGGVLPPAKPLPEPRGLSDADAGVLGALLDTKTSPDLDDLFPTDEPDPAEMAGFYAETYGAGR